MSLYGKSAVLETVLSYIAALSLAATVLVTSHIMEHIIKYHRSAV